MEERAKVYSTTNRKAYWEIEAKKTFFKYLRSEGYYGHTMEVEIPEVSNQINFNITLGPRYTISDITNTYVEGSNTKINILKYYKFGIAKGDYAIAQNILDAEKKLLEYIENKNCILTMSISHEATINHDDKTVGIKFLIDAGPNTTLEKVEFTGLKTIKPEYVRKLVKLKDGYCLKQSYINDARENLLQSGLFASTDLIVPEHVKKDGSVPIIFDLNERKTHSFKAGAAYDTAIGPELKFGWENRNLFGSGENLKSEIKGNLKEQIISLDYTKPFYKRDDQTLKLGISYEKSYEDKKLKPYAIKQTIISSSIERELTKNWTAGVGVELTHSKVKKFELSSSAADKNYSLISTPLFASYDARNNRLDPKKGHLIEFESTPYFSLANKEKPFLKSQVSASTYFASKTKFLPILAIRAATGTISGAGQRGVPENARFYVGGNNSLRGYAFQSASDLDANNRPKGGKSFFETNIEVRLKVNSSIGVVGFLDSGYAYDSIKPQPNKNLLYGAGFGVRYLSTFGPIRFDIGFPLKRRKFADKSYQLYFGIGQSF